MPKYPAMTRDIALTVDEDITVAEIEKIIFENGGSLLKSVKLFDVYRGKQVAENKKSVAFSLIYRAEDKTLTDEEVVKVHDVVLKNLAEKLKATLREM